MTRVNAAFAILVSLFCGAQPRGADTLASGSRKIAVARPASGNPSPSQGVTLGVEEVASGFNSPVYLTAPDGGARRFVVEQEGRIRIIRNGSVVGRPFLDITDKVGSGGERGLLSVAFHPRYRTNGFLFVNYTDKSGDTNIERYRVSRDPDAADPATGRVILKIDQPHSNHNGGMNLFGPDGMLYIGMGDGGSQYDPHGNGQNPNSLLGKLLRINVDRVDPYSVPAANPYAHGGGRGEVWAIGLRNPWRYAFDAKDGNLYIADVGQDRFEEVDVVPANRAGVNYGWSIMEGASCLRGSDCNRAGLQLPALTYAHGRGECSITGGFVYRGRKIPAIDGHYFYSDYCNSWLKSFKYVNGQVTDERQWPVGRLGSASSFGLDGAGEMYIVSHSTGRIFRIVAR